MKLKILILFLLFSFITGFPSCDKNNVTANNSNTQNNSNTHNNNDGMNSKIRIKIGSSTFSATLLNNDTVTAFKALLPMTINMVELNGNEKYFNLSANLPTNTSNPSAIQTGDLMMYGAKTLVLFYKSFSTSYNYTSLGHIDDTTGLSTAVGDGNVSITFELL